MSSPDNRDRFIPFRKTDIVEMCLSNGRLAAPEHQSFRGFCRILDNNAGVFHHLIDAAEEEEFKEAVLAYYFL